MMDRKRAEQIRNAIRSLIEGEPYIKERYRLDKLTWTYDEAQGVLVIDEEQDGE